MTVAQSLPKGRSHTLDLSGGNLWVPRHAPCNRSSTSLMRRWGQNRLGAPSARAGRLIPSIRVHTCVWTVNSKHGFVCPVHRSALGFMGRVCSARHAPSPATLPEGRDACQDAMNIWELQMLLPKANTFLGKSLDLEPSFGG